MKAEGLQVELGEGNGDFRRSWSVGKVSLRRVKLENKGHSRERTSGGGGPAGVGIWQSGGALGEWRQMRFFDCCRARWKRGGGLLQRTTSTSCRREKIVQT